MSNTPVFAMARGDRRTPIARTLKQGGQAVDLTDKTVEFSCVAEDNTVVVDWTSVGVTIVSATAGKVQYTFQADDITAMSTHEVLYYWFRISEGGVYTTIPPGGRVAKIVVQPAG